MELKVKLLELIDADALFKFELENKEYFNSVGLGRPEQYYERESLNEILTELIEEQQRQEIFMYQVWDDNGEVVGRVNLTSVIRGPLNKAELGYRIGQRHQGKGYATMAVGLVILEAIEKLKLHRLEAGTAVDNIGSQIVLIKNGFQFVGRWNKYMLKNDVWKDSLSFERILD